MFAVPDVSAAIADRLQGDVDSVQSCQLVVFIQHQAWSGGLAQPIAWVAEFFSGWLLRAGGGWLAARLGSRRVGGGQGECAEAQGHDRKTRLGAVE